MAKGTEKQSTTSVKIRADIANQIKFIAMWDDTTQMEIFDSVLIDYIKKWKAKHPDVKFPGNK